ncbi:MAG: ATP-binding cassette domain-containing protein, partial [Eubacteriales bacterium]
MLKFYNVRAAYGKHTVLDGVTFALRPHTLTAVIGRNGCGKSTLVGCVNSQVKYTGEISYSGRPIALMTRTEAARCVAILPQLLTSPHITVEELVGYGRSPYLPLGAHF